MIRILSTCLLAVVFFSASASAQTILSWLRNSVEHETFVRLLPFIRVGPPLVQCSGDDCPNLDNVLGDPNMGPFTIFAPSDDAFTKFVRQFTPGGGSPANSNETVSALSQIISKLGNTPNAPTINDVVFYHAVSGSITLEQLEEDSPVDTLSGSFTLSVNATERTVSDLSTRDPIRVSQENKQMDNGYVHVTADVLLPVPTGALEAILIPTPTSSSSPTPSPTPSMSMSSAASPSLSPAVEATVPAGTPVPPTDMDATPTPEDGSGNTGGGPDPTPSATVEIDDGATPDGGETGDGDDNDGSDSAVSAEPTENAGDDNAVCFPASARVTLASGETVTMKDLTAEHEVKHSANAASRVFLFTHRTPAVRTRMVRISTSCNHAVTMSLSHYVRTPSGLVAAGDVTTSDEVITISGACKVVSTERVAAVGLYAPHTLHGDIVVDGVVASSYARSVHPRVAHALLLPVRFVAKRQNMFKEPLGSMLYNGAPDWLHNFIPRGGNRVATY